MEINFNESSDAIIGRLNHPDDIKKYFSSKTFKDFLADKTSPLVYCTLSLDGKEFLSRSSFEIILNQKTNDHDSFTITVPDDALDSFSGYVLENSKNILGKKITINFHRFGEVKNLFSGVIANIKNKKENGYGKLFITGFAPSILLESGKDCKSFEDKTLEQIIKEVTSEYPEEAKIDASNIVNSSYSIPYTVQYKESDYGFIQRLAKRYGEYFYYNGQQLVFGNKVQPIISLEDGVDLIEAEFELGVKPQDFKYMVYDAEKGSKTEKDSSSTRTQYKENPFQAIAVSASKNVFKKIPDVLYNHTGIGGDTDKALSEAVRREKENRENLVKVTGKSKDPNLKIGGRAKLIDINNKAMETYRIIEIKHFHNGNEYYNEFVGIPDLFNAPYQDNEAFPIGEEQSARVVDNNDPMGRVRVQFPWQEKKGEKTPWLRIATLHTGAGKGTHIIPEIGEEVLVAYESGNTEKPYVSGALYNGKEKSGYHTANNDIKAIHTRSGTKIILNDAEGSVFIEDPSGNTYLMDGKGNIKVKAPKNMSFDAGKNMYFTVGENMITNIGMNKTVFTGMNYVRTVGMNYNSNITGNSTTSIKGKGLTMGESEMKIEAKQMDVAGFDNLLLHSNKSAKVNSKGLVDIQGLDGTNQNNTPDDYLKTILEIEAVCIANVRPLATWKGEFGCDYFQSGNIALGEKETDDYAKLIGKYYNKNDEDMKKLKEKSPAKKSFSEHFFPSTENLWFSFKDLSGTYQLVHNFHNDPQYGSDDNKLDKLQELYAAFKYKKKKEDKETINYYATYLTLFPSDWATVVPKKATLQIFIEFLDPENKPDDLIFKYDNKLIDANSPVKISRPIIASPTEKELITIETVEKGKYNAITEDFIAVEIFARKKQGEINIETKAGEIRILNPAKAKTLKMLEIKVKSASEESGKISENQKKFCKKILNQCLIDTEFIAIDSVTNNLFTLDLSQEELRFEKKFKAKSVGKKDNKVWTIYNDTQENDLYKLLDKEFQKKYPDYKKDEFFPLYLMDVNEMSGSSSVLGYTYSNHNFCVIFRNADDGTLPHECLHGLGLHHTFNSKNTFVYKAMATHNVMDYNMLEDPTDKIRQINNGTEAEDIVNNHTRMEQYLLWTWQWTKANKSKYLTS